MSAPVIAVTATSSRVPVAVATASLVAGFRDAGMTVRLLALADGPAVGALLGDEPDAVEGVGRLPVVVQGAAVAAAARQDGADLVVVHAPVGLLAPLDATNASLRDLLGAVVALDVRSGVVVATTPDDDALGHSALVAEALRTREIDVLGVVVTGHDGPWPDAARLQDVTGAPVLGTTPDGAETWDADRFTAQAGAWLPLE